MNPVPARDLDQRHLGELAVIPVAGGQSLVGWIYGVAVYPEGLVEIHLERPPLHNPHGLGSWPVTVYALAPTDLVEVSA